MIQIEEENIQRTMTTRSFEYKFVFVMGKTAIQYTA